MSLQHADVNLMQAVILDWKATDRNDLSLQSLYQLNLNWQINDKTDNDKITPQIRDKQIVVTNKVELNRQVLEQAPELKLVCVSATGSNNVDLAAARELGISVCNVTAYATASVVQYVFAVLLSLASRLPDYQQAVKKGDWSRSQQFCLLDYSFNELQGKTLGIIGYGELGQAVARIAKAFGMNVLIAKRDDDDSREGRIGLKDMLPGCDVLSLHCPLTPQTENLIAAEQLQMLPKGAIVINSARGGIVNEEALLAALKSGHLAGAATDVLSAEPPPADHILLQQDLPNLIITPHIAWASIESRQRLIDQVAFNISEFLAGRPRNIVN